MCRKRARARERERFRVKLGLSWGYMYLYICTSVCVYICISVHVYICIYVYRRRDAGVDDEGPESNRGGFVRLRVTDRLGGIAV